MVDLEALVKECGLNLYDTEVVNENGRAIFRVYITKDGGVNLDDCEKVSRILSPIFDVEPPLNGDYNLEVSSPGLERVLSKKEHFLKSIGENLKVKTINKENFEGKILSFIDEILTIKNQNQTLQINFNEIKKAKTYIKW
ncbi:ribosome maturation factor RimP [Campylobacter sp. FMV-PI01]|uniref:Ribosome maturation factor RimP n=1 Tax=Campylobacter portucalensis TaxID=2608384 RepID=A0A6L5WFJ8_9BACT|nr:ribosome maturation factor RimP [Campylobacter portucalensis]MSN95830.1 ribosome maturation factor RimP [Campylobacter portucalensis]